MAVVDLRDILRDNDLVGEILSTHSGALTRTKIDNALTAAGHTLPLPHKVTFHLYNVANMYLVTWFPAIDKYGVEKLTLKG